jgi:dUTP pyrophosphatase
MEPVTIELAGGKMPVRAKEGDAGYDLYSPTCYVAMPGAVQLLDLCVRMEIPDGYYGMIKARSGLAVRHGMQVLGGVIDSGYRGNIKLAFTCLEKLEIAPGDRVAQIVFQKYYTGLVKGSVGNSERGSGGFGSSGR